MMILRLKTFMLRQQNESNNLSALQKRDENMYELDNPIIYPDFNEYFIRTVLEKSNTYFLHFLCRYENILDGKVKKFLRRYDLDSDRIDDLKQIFSSVLWTKLQEYDPDCEIPFLQLVKFDIQNAWHEYVRTSCGVTHIPTDHTYRLIRKAAQIYYAESDHDSGITAVSRKLELIGKKSEGTYWLRYSV